MSNNSDHDEEVKKRFKEIENSIESSSDVYEKALRLKKAESNISNSTTNLISIKKNIMI